MIAPWASPVMVSGPKSRIRSEKFTVPPGRAAGGVVPPAAWRSDLRSLLVRQSRTIRVELERPDLDQGGIQLTGVGELVGVGDSRVVDAGQVAVELLHRRVALADALHQDVGRVEGDVAVGTRGHVPPRLVVGDEGAARLGGRGAGA